MADESDLKPCSYYLVRYVPNAEREEFLNIGVLLHSPGDNYLNCLFTDDYHRIKRFHPAADMVFLRDLQSYFVQQIQRREDDLQGFLDDLQQSLSHLIQLGPARPMLAADLQAQLHELSQRLVGMRQAGFPADDTRMGIKQHLVEALRRARVFDHPCFEKRIPAERWTHSGDPFHFDFGYRPPIARGKPNGHLKLVHALSLHRDPDLASVLALTIGYVRALQPAELTAVINSLPEREDRVASHSYRILRDAEIAVQPVAGANLLALSIQNELLAIAPGPT